MQIKRPLAALFFVAWLVSSYAGAEVLTLAAATKKTLSDNPFLNVYKLNEEALHARRQTAALRPATRSGRLK